MAAASPSHNLATLLLRSADRFPRWPAIALGTRVVHDYAALASRVRRLAATLRTALPAGERVMLVAMNCPEYIETLFACWHAGLCAVPVNSKLHPDEVKYVIENSAARWMFVDETWRGGSGAK